jgi:uncharacterized protein YbaR (Trm112 family)
MEDFMKIWLFDILACPLDKHFPLELYIFSFENESEEFQSILTTYLDRDINLIKNEQVIEISHEDNEIYINDNIIIEKTSLQEYLKLTFSSLIEFENIYDNTTNKITKKCIETIKSNVKSKIIEFSKEPLLNQINSILPELFFINKIKLDFEVKSGLLFCNKCKRWYPIIDSIPQMLPDKYRDEKKEIEFLKNNKNLLDEKFFDQDLKPYKI